MGDLYLRLTIHLNILEEDISIETSNELVKRFIEKTENITNGLIDDLPITVMTKSTDRGWDENKKSSIKE